MIVAVASGKGGTGKTTVATNLACLAAQSGYRVTYVDCDVEEPNGHLFLRPTIHHLRPIHKPVPAVDQQRCTHCGECARVCRFGAIASLPDQTLVFAELCHACGGCALVCPVEAIEEEARTIGTLRSGDCRCEKGSAAIRFVDGELKLGEAMSPPAIRAVKAEGLNGGQSGAGDPGEDHLTILDSPPGTSCPVIETVRGCDLVVLVTEPTPFGLYDLTLAVEMVRGLKLPAGVVINRADAGDGGVREYCRGHLVPILAEIPDERAVAEAYSRGRLAVEAVAGFAGRMRELLARLETGITQ